MQSSLLSYVFNKIFRYLFFKKNMQQKELCRSGINREENLSLHFLCFKYSTNFHQTGTVQVQLELNFCPL
jgi:hypothetical protein